MDIISRKKFLYFLFLLLVMESVFSIGLAPTQSIFDYVNGDQEGRFRVIVQEVPTQIELSKEGRLRNSISFEQENIVLNEKETWINFNLDTEGLEPGKNTGKIKVTEISSGESMVQASTSVIHNVEVFVPYPEKYLQGEAIIEYEKEGVWFVIALRNRGEESINKIEGNIIIKDPDGKRVEKINFDEMVNIEPGKEYQLKKLWESPKLGIYDAKINLRYGKKELEMTKKLEVGEPDVSVQKLNIQGKPGEITRLTLDVKNEWNQPLIVDMELEIYNENQTITTLRSQPEEINERGRGTLEAYWDTKDASLGDYELVFNLNYGKETKTKIYNSTLSENEIIILGQKDTKFVIDFKALMLAVISVVLLMFLTLFVVKMLDTRR